MYKAIQTELVRIHMTSGVEGDKEIDPHKEHQHVFRRRLTQLSEEDDMDDEDAKYYDEDISPPSKKPGTYQY